MSRVLMVQSFILLFLLTGIVHGRMPIDPLRGLEIPPEISEAETMNEIEPFLTNPDFRIRMVAVRRIGQIGDKASVPMLMESFEREPPRPPLREVRPFVKEEIIKALKEIGGREAKYAIFEIFKEYINKGPRIEESEEARIVWDGTYSIIMFWSIDAIYDMYKIEEDEKIHDFIKTIALGEKRDWYILQDGRLRRIAFQIYYKTKLHKMGLTGQEKLEHIKESMHPSPSRYEARFIDTQEIIENRAKNQLLRELR